jgi:hypothetical protein
MKKMVSKFRPVKVMGMLGLVMGLILSICMAPAANASEVATPEAHATDVAAGLTSLDKIDVNVTSTDITSIQELNDYLQSDALKDVTVDPDTGNIVAVSDLKTAPIPRYISQGCKMSGAIGCLWSSSAMLSYGFTSGIYNGKWPQIKYIWAGTSASAIVKYGPAGSVFASKTVGPVARGTRVGFGGANVTCYQVVSRI